MERRECIKFLLVPALLLLTMIIGSGMKNEDNTIYKDGWIDFNKNGVKDIFEDPSQKIDDRVDNLLSLMNVEEKTCQLATLYGYARVLEDELPNEKWKDRVWKDGICNIDEHLNTIHNRESTYTQYSFPFSKHAEALNTVQKWFVEETRMGIPVKYSNLIVTPSEAYSQGDIHVSFEVSNTGNREGDEIVQLYLKDKVSSVTTYESQLRGFDRVHLLPEETKTVSFTLHPDDLKLLDKNMNWTVEPGLFKVMIGSSSVDIRLCDEFEILNN